MVSGYDGGRGRLIYCNFLEFNTVLCLIVFGVHSAVWRCTVWFLVRFGGGIVKRQVIYDSRY